MRAVLLLGASLLPPGCDAAARLEDHTASWEAAGLSDRLANVHADALPPRLFEAVADVAPVLLPETSAAPGETYKFGKRNTWWMPLFDGGGARRAPRSVLEAAVHALFDLDFGGGDGSSSPRAAHAVVGAEWWIQERGRGEGIGFHYDKDEAYASEYMTMRFPEVSTVTYLGAVGAPTLILNQTTPDGYPLSPRVMLRGSLPCSFPVLRLREPPRRSCHRNNVTACA